MKSVINCLNKTILNKKDDIFYIIDQIKFYRVTFWIWRPILQIEGPLKLSPFVMLALEKDLYSHF